MLSKISIPQSLQPILDEIPHAYFIGGCVRDAILGLEPKDLAQVSYFLDFPKPQKLQMPHFQQFVKNRSRG